MAEKWYVTIDRDQHGPIVSAEVRRLAASGKLRPTDLVRKESMSTWVAASTVRGLFPDITAPPKLTTPPPSNAPSPPQVAVTPVVESPEAAIHVAQPDSASHSTNLAHAISCTPASVWFSATSKVKICLIALMAGWAIWACRSDGNFEALTIVAMPTLVFAYYVFSDMRYRCAAYTNALHKDDRDDLRHTLSSMCMSSWSCAILGFPAYIAGIQSLTNKEEYAALLNGPNSLGVVLAVVAGLAQASLFIAWAIRFELPEFSKNVGIGVGSAVSAMLLFMIFLPGSDSVFFLAAGIGGIALALWLLFASNEIPL